MSNLLTVSELARKVGKTEQAIYADLARGKWPHVKIGRRVFFRLETIEAFIEAHEHPAQETINPDGKQGVS